MTLFSFKPLSFNLLFSKVLFSKVLFSKILFVCIVGIYCSFSVVAADAGQAKLSLERLSQSLRQLNFNTSFVVVKNNQAEPYHWLHGVVEKQALDSNGINKKEIELEILALLNGPRRDILRINNTVSYIEPEYAPYSIHSEQISGPIPTVFGRDISVLEKNYHFVSVGKNRVLGKAAQLIRIVPKDGHRFGYWLWLDQKSGLLLKLAVITRQGKLLEQIQFTHLDITNSISESLKQLQTTELPKAIDMATKKQPINVAWQVNWLPDGFELIKSDKHRIKSNKQAVEFMLFNDGLVDISVYVNPSKAKQRKIEFASDGATLVLNQVINNIEVSIVGKIPLETAKKIVSSVSFNRKVINP